MKKKIVLLLALVLMTCTMSSCGYLPTALLSDMLATNSGSTAVTSADGESITISKEEYERYKQFDTLLELMDLVDYGYFEEYDVQDMLDGAANGLLLGLGDPYTFYYTPEEYAELWEEDEGEYAGVGIQISTS